MVRSHFFRTHFHSDETAASDTAMSDSGVSVSVICRLTVDTRFAMSADVERPRLVAGDGPDANERESCRTQ